MVVLILSAAPASLRGAMTRWLLEVSPGVFVGHLSGVAPPTFLGRNPLDGPFWFSL